MDVVEEARTAIDARTSQLADAGIQTEIVTHSRSSGMFARFTSALSMADLVIWATGEADLIWAVIADGDPTTDHYEITSAMGLSALLDDLQEHLRA